MTNLCESVEYANNIVSGQLTLSELAIVTFAVMLFFSLDYVWKLFKLDEELSKTSMNGDISQQSSITTAKEYRKRIMMGRQREDQVVSTLQKLSIPFERNVRWISKEQKHISSFDIVIPNIKNLMYIIEIRRGLGTSDQGRRLIFLANQIKSEHSDCKLILIIDRSSTRLHLLESIELPKYWDFILDFSEVEKLKDIIKLD